MHGHRCSLHPVPSSENIHASSPLSTSVFVRPENPLDAVRWNDLISPHLNASIFHQTAWAKVLADTYGFTPVYLASFAGEKLSGALPLMEVDSWLTGKRGVSLPFTDECESLVFSGESGAALVQEALKTGRTRGWKYLELRGGKDFFNAPKPSLAFYGHKLNLTATTERLFNQFESSVRRALRKANQSGLRVEFSQTLEATAAYYSLHCATRKEHGLPPQPFKFFRSIQEHILGKNLGIIATAKFQERPVASAVYFFQGAAAVYKFGASLKTALDARANNLVMWQAIQWLAARGIKELKFGRTSLHHEGLRRYKLGWGTEEYPINYYKYDFGTGALVSERDASSGWHNSLFRALPLPVSKSIGRLLYKHVA